MSAMRGAKRGSDAALGSWQGLPRGRRRVFRFALSVELLGWKWVQWVRYLGLCRRRPFALAFSFVAAARPAFQVPGVASRVRFDV